MNLFFLQPFTLHYTIIFCSLQICPLELVLIECVNYKAWKKYHTIYVALHPYIYIKETNVIDTCTLL